ncbi:AAA family ATPase [Alkaliphilus sp. MSJ-5]|uniref:endopeptidase La n=1 Tax=Alkaliphilus flagellatus TaxID=2841507 RepID=A0ABS6FXP6_9FIRM|nr:ATP-binding protein [Alkaliphilus flagellatus]MBU5674995.1 AAA family ATPase [Alkaliphilus flagellatus]
MYNNYRLPIEKLTSPCNVEDLQFETTANLDPLKGIIGQKRGAEALSFGLKIRKRGYNIYVAGISGTGRSSYTKSITEEFASQLPIPYDWVYVYNFKNRNCPSALSLEPGIGIQFKNDIEEMIEKLKKIIPETFKGVEYEVRKNEIMKVFQQKNQEVMQELNEKAKEYGFYFTATENGLMTTPLKDGIPMKQEEYEGLSPAEIEDIMEMSNQLNINTIEIIDKFRMLEEEVRKKIKQLDQYICYDIVNFDINKIYKKYAQRKSTVEYINNLEKDIIENIDKFKSSNEETKSLGPLEIPINQEENFFNRYKINLFIDNSGLSHAPIIDESNPTFNNLLGSIEYKNELGVLKTDFMQIKPGALHLANGGFLVIHIKELLSNSFSWDILKRALKAEEVNIENLNKQMGHVVASTLKPEPVPLNIKIILIGDYYTYSALYSYDDDFRKLFKVMAEFDVEMIKSQENIYKMAEFIADHCEKEGLKHFDKWAVGRVVEYSSRLADHQDKLTSRFNQIVEILYESDLWAEEDGASIISKKHIEKAIREKINRSSKYEEKLSEMFVDGSLLIDVDGEKIGQINGLAVMGTGEYSFGKPSRITVATYSGEEGIINIEREAKQSGNIHDKGVFILSGYLGEKYAKFEPMGLTVSIGFEQNYSIIDGDSASSTELYAILSSISEVPIKQYIAVTGSVNQKGEIQPIGGVNEKIEGFFEICKLKGLTGEQGVMIPSQNIKNLMLKEEVINAVKNNEFHIYAINTIEQGIEILTGKKAGVLGECGEYPENTINNLIMKKLRKMTNIETRERKN